MLITLTPDVKNIWFLDPRDHEVRSLADNCIFHSGHSVKNDRPVAAVNIVEGRIGHSAGHGQAKTKLADSCEYLRHFPKLKTNKWGLLSHKNTVSSGQFNETFTAIRLQTYGHGYREN